MSITTLWRVFATFNLCKNKANQLVKKIDNFDQRILLHCVIFCTQCPFSPSIDLSNSNLISWDFRNRKLLRTLSFQQQHFPTEWNFFVSYLTKPFHQRLIHRSEIMLTLPFRFAATCLKVFDYIFSLYFKIVIKDVLEISSSLASIDTGVSFLLFTSLTMSYFSIT